MNFFKKIIPDISERHREEVLGEVIDNLTNEIVLTYLSDAKLFQNEAEKKIINALMEISSKEKTSKTLTKIKDIHETIITFSSHKIRLIENLQDKKRATEILAQLSDTLLILANLLNIDFDIKDNDESEKNTHSMQQNEH